MSTYMPKANEVERKWYLLDAEGKSLGKVAAEAATLLRGKHKPDFMPNVDTGDFVIIINSDKAVLTGKKLEQKIYYRFTGYIGNMKKIQYKTLMKEHSDVAMKKAVKGMLPDSTLGRKQLTRLHIYKGAEHKHEAQKPEVRDF
ncbi:MAG: 50S ribosomal protein L13 [Oscillospiraceae bacterium]|jgi:large subunit ribosomal protein L13|nr:50S ribosomal protein L13 [Oscillospiraceae bacterium]